MDILSQILGGAIFAGLVLLSCGDNKIKTIQTGWNDDVGRSISRAANSSIDHFNSTMEDCSRRLSDAKSAAERAASQVNYNSQKSNLEWYGSKVEEIDIEKISGDANKLCSDINYILKG